MRERLRSSHQTGRVRLTPSSAPRGAHDVTHKIIFLQTIVWLPVGRAATAAGDPTWDPLVLHTVLRTAARVRPVALMTARRALPEGYQELHEPGDVSCLIVVHAHVAALGADQESAAR